MVRSIAFFCSRRVDGTRPQRPDILRTNPHSFACKQGREAVETYKHEFMRILAGSLYSAPSTRRSVSGWPETAGALVRANKENLLFWESEMKEILFGFTALLFLFGTVEAAKANPVDVSFTVSGSAGNWVYDFSVTNNLGAGTELYLFGVRLPDAVAGSIVYPTGWIASSPGGYNPSIYGGTNTNYNVLWITCSSSAVCDNQYGIFDGQTLSGFQISDSGLTALTSVSWMAVDAGYYGPPQTGCSFICGAPYTNPGFEGLAAEAVAATPLPATLPLVVVGLAGFGLLGWRRKRKSIIFDSQRR